MSNTLTRLTESAAKQSNVATASDVSMTLDEVWWLAERIAAGGLFACKTPAEAFGLMMIAQSKGLHPMVAMERYHIVEGRPSMRADAMQALFLADGGRIKIVRRDDQEARAIFSHPIYQAEPVEYGVTLDDFQKKGLMLAKDGNIKKNWKQHPGAMLWARLVTTMIRTIAPGIVAGIYSTEEVEDMGLESAQPALEQPRELRRSIEHTPPTAANVDTMRLPGQSADAGFDNREYRDVVIDGVKAVNIELAACGAEPLKSAEIHRHLCLRAINAGHHPGPPPATANAAIPVIVRLYRDQREWVRSELGMFFLGVVEQAREDARLREEAKAGQGDEEQPDDPTDDILPREPGSDG